MAFLRRPDKPTEPDVRAKPSLEPWIATAVAWIVFAWPRFWAWRSGYELIGDAAVVSIRAAEVLRPGSPLLGMPSSLGDWSTAADPNHPGPAVFWQMAPTAHLFGGGLGELTGSFLLCAVFSWWMIHTSCRRFGPAAAPAAAAAAVMTAGFWSSANAGFGTLPALAVAFAAWSVLDDDRTAWPWLAAASSFAVQADLAFLIPIALLVIAAVVHEVRRSRRPGQRSVDVGSASPKRVVRRTLITLAIFWVLPLVDALANQGGNVRELLKAATADIPVRGALAALPWLIAMAVPVIVTSPWLTRSWRAARPGRRPLTIAAAIGAAGAAISQAMVPIGNSPSLTWLPAATALMFVIFTVATLTVDEIVGRRERRPVWLRRAAWTGLFLTVLVISPTITGFSYQEEWYPAVDPLASAISDLPGGAYRLQPLSNPLGTALAHGLIDATNPGDVDLRVDDGLASYLGPRHRTRGSESKVLYLSTQSMVAPVRGARLVGRWADPTFNERRRAELDRKVAKEIRRHQPRWTSGAGAFQVGSIAAAGGTQQSSLDDDDLNKMGYALTTGAAPVEDLSDGVIAELVAQGYLELPSSSSELLARLQKDRSTGVVSIWIADNTS